MSDEELFKLAGHGAQLFDRVERIEDQSIDAEFSEIDK
jgi:hypothetical protein